MTQQHHLAPHAAPSVLPWHPPVQGTDGVSVAGFVLSILFWPVGLVLSCVGLSRTSGGRPGRGLAVAGLVISLVQVLLLPVLAAVAIPTFLNQRDKAVEAGLRSDLQTAAVAMETAAVDANGTYPTVMPPVTTSTGTVELVSVGPDTYCLVAVAAGSGTVRYVDQSGVVSEIACG